MASTAAAAVHAASEWNAAAVANRRVAAMYGLDVLVYPLESDVPNVTVFFAISGAAAAPARRDKSTFAVRLPNTPGSLCTFLEAFRDEGVNLSQLISRPIRGCPRQYAFLVDVEAGVDAAPVRKALRRARRTAVQIRTVGSYPCLPAYTS